MRALALLFSLAVLAVAAPSAGAAVGDLTYDGCLANDSSQGCLAVPESPMGEPVGVAVSPDGRSVYVASVLGDSVSHFFRNGEDGRLAWDGCLNDTGAQNCGDVPEAPLNGARSVAVSPDGKSVYVATGESDGIAHLHRSGPDGQIVWAGCLNNGGTQGCTDLPGAPLDAAFSVAVSPDGKSVYVASAGSNTVSHLFRDTQTGALTWDGCLGNTNASACVDLPAAPLSIPRSVAVSPDGRSVYVASAGSTSVAHLFRNTATGQISWDGCLNNDGSQNCGDLPGAPMTDVTAVTVSPDGRSVYAAALASSSVSHFFRNLEGGQIAWDGCLSSVGPPNCGDVPGAPLDGAFGIAASPDDASIYVASISNDSVSLLRRSGPDGQITWGGCLADTAADGCVDLPAEPLRAASGVAVSPDGRSVYVTSPTRNGIAHFAREPMPAAPDPAPGDDDPQAPDGPAPPVTEAPAPEPPAAITPSATQTPVDALAPLITRARVVQRRRGRRRVLKLRFTLSEAATVAIVVRRAGRGRRARRISRSGVPGVNRVRLRSRRGRYRALLTAVDAAGNRSAPVTVRYRVRRR